MKLVIEAAHKAGVIVEDPNTMYVDGGLLVRVNIGKENDLKKLKSNTKFYFYIDDMGYLSHVGGLFRQEPTGNEVLDLSSFRDAASVLFSIEPRRSLFGKEDQKVLHRETLRLKGSRIVAPYLDIKKVQLAKSEISGRTVMYAFISGRIYRVRDSRLDYLHPKEQTTFGKGQFDIDNVKVLPNGNFLHLVLSPYAEQIEKLVEQQQEAFDKYASLYTETDPSDKNIWVSKYEHTRKLLKPHANEIYKYKDGFIYYINTGGNWQVDSVAGLRNFDLYDHDRVYRHLSYEGDLDRDLVNARQQLSSKSLLDQRKLANISAALQPDILDTRKKQVEEIKRRQSKFETLKPLDGPLGTNDLPGLKSGVTLFPHQAMILASLKDRDRMLVDADPGAGKALMIICDILQQMKKGKIRRPLVLMPDSLIPQFANEVRHFSELNPWIISTESIKRWGKTKELPEFIEDAKRAPRNTVFLTSYTWISLEPDMVPNGEVSESGGKISYKKSKVFNRVNVLLNRLGIDAVFEDECHILRGSSNMARAAMGLAEVSVVRGFTGTVMPGNPYDVTASMSPIHSSVFGTKDDFLRDHTVSGSINEYKNEAPKQIRKKLKDFGVLSVRRSAWAHLLPKVHRHTHFVEFTDAQKKAYKALLVNILDEIRKDPILSVLLKRIEDSLEQGDEITAGPLLARFTPLDVFLNSPAEAKDWLKALMLGDNAVSPKAKKISEIIRSHFTDPEAGKVLVFVQYKEAAKNLLNNLAPDLKEKAAYYEGGMIGILNRFKAPQDPLKILIAVDKSLVTGHNLQIANCIIHADLKWKSGDLSQREARAARIGQKRDVHIHTVLVKGSSELLKMARLISADHITSKANSDFTDNSMLQPMQMTLSNMETFTKEEQLHPYLDRKKAIDLHIEKQSIKDRDFYGPTMLKPHGYSKIDSLFREAKELKKVPSTKDFVGNIKDHESLVEKDLEELPEEPKHPKILNLNLMLWDTDWYLFSYKSADPNGFLRSLGFSLMLGYYYVELVSKAEVGNIVRKLEKHFEITNKPEFERQVRETRVITQGIKKGLRNAAQKARQRVAAEKEEVSPDYIDKSKKEDITLEFSTVDGAPVIWIYNTFTTSDPELPTLKRIGFELEPPLWRRLITRSQLKLFLTKLQEDHPQIRIANWEDFKSIVSLSFGGLNLDQFDGLAEK